MCQVSLSLLSSQNDTFDWSFYQLSRAWWLSFEAESLADPRWVMELSCPADELCLTTGTWDDCRWPAVQHLGSCANSASQILSLGKPCRKTRLWDTYGENNFLFYSRLYITLFPGPWESSGMLQVYRNRFLTQTVQNTFPVRSLKCCNV